MDEMQARLAAINLNCAAAFDGDSSDSEEARHPSFGDKDSLAAVLYCSCRFALQPVSGTTRNSLPAAVV